MLSKIKYPPKSHKVTPFWLSVWNENAEIILSPQLGGCPYNFIC